MNDHIRYSKIFIECMRSKKNEYIYTKYITESYSDFSYKMITIDDFYRLRRLLKKKIILTMLLSKSEVVLLKRLGLDLTKDFAAESCYLALEVVK